VGATGFEPVTPSVSGHARPFARPLAALPGTTSALLRRVPEPGPAVRREAAYGIAADKLLTGRRAPARPTQAPSGPVGLRSAPDPSSNLCSICWFSGDLARVGLGQPARSSAGAVRAAARRRPGHRPQAGRQGRALPPRRRHQDLEPDTAGAPAPSRGVQPAARRLPRPSTNAAVALEATYRPDQADQHFREPQWLTPTSRNATGSPASKPRERGGGRPATLGVMARSQGSTLGSVRVVMRGLPVCGSPCSTRWMWPVPRGRSYRRTDADLDIGWIYGTICSICPRSLRKRRAGS
jgi:hypothetical protein